MFSFKKNSFEQRSPYELMIIILSSVSIASLNSTFYNVCVGETTKHLRIFLIPNKFMSHSLQEIIKNFIMIYSIKICITVTIIFFFLL